jgi:hypothetical protein
MIEVTAFGLAVALPKLMGAFPNALCPVVRHRLCSSY